MSAYQVRFFVRGTPIPKGSMVNNHGRGGRLMQGVHDVNASKLKVWERAIKIVALRYKPPEPLGGPFIVETIFYIERPPTITRQYPTVPPDRDKLLRAVQDALTKVIYIDDAQVIGGDPKKRYADTCPPGVQINIKHLGDNIQEVLPF